MIGRALEAGTPAAWVTGDEVYGGDPRLRASLEQRQIGYVLAVAKSHTVATSAGPARPDALAGKLPPRSWQRLSAGAGAKGHRWYDWAWVAAEPGCPGHHWLLIRRNRHTRELAFYRCWSPRRVPLPALVRVAGIRWSTEENLAAGKSRARAGRTPSPHLDLLASVGHPGHARRGLPHRGRRGRARPAAAARDDPAHPQRDRPPHCGPGNRAGAPGPAPAGLVGVAPPSPAHRPHLPLPAAGR